jgi:hypothetical protein
MRLWRMVRGPVPDHAGTNLQAFTVCHQLVGKRQSRGESHMKKLLSFLLLPFCLQAQLLLTLTGPATITQGNSGTLTLTMSGSSGQNVAALEWGFTLPAGFTVGSPTLSAAFTAAGLAASCNTADTLCIAIDTAATPTLADGVVATIPFTVSSSAALGATTLPLANLFGANTAGESVNPASGTAYSVKVLSPCDVLGLGTVTVADAQAVISGALGTASCPLTAAQGGCTIVTAEDVVLAILGGACKIQ